MLARPENKSKVDRLTAEIDAFGRNRVPTFDDLDSFPWLEVRQLSPQPAAPDKTWLAEGALLPHRCLVGIGQI